MNNLLKEQLQKESDYYKLGKDFQKNKTKRKYKSWRKEFIS